jgi:ubiquinone/menaquinone biosynthesis C-methylase UbiE
MARPFGSKLSHAGKITLRTADDVQVMLKGSFLERTALRVFGIPHMGMRIRASSMGSMLPHIDGKKVLDAGCGPGLHMLLLTEKKAYVIGMDADRKKIKSGAEIAGALGCRGQSLSVADITHLPFTEGEFDVILCSDVLEHVRDDGKALSEFSRVLKESGKLVITVPTEKLGAAYHRSFGHVRPGYDFAAMEKKLEKNRFRIEKWDYYLKSFGSISWRLNRFFFSNKALAALTFYPLYLFSKLDRALPKGHIGEGLAIRAVRQP